MHKGGVRIQRDRVTEGGKYSISVSMSQSEGNDIHLSTHSTFTHMYIFKPVTKSVDVHQPWGLSSSHLALSASGCSGT